MNTNTTTTTGMPSIQDYISQTNKNDTLIRTNGQLTQQIIDLKEQIKKAEEKQPYIKLITQSDSNGDVYWGKLISGISKPTVQYINMSEAESIVRKDLESKYETEISELKSLRQTLKYKEEDLELLQQEMDRRLTKAVKVERDESNQIINEKNKIIDKLKEDFKKLKDNNTDIANNLRRKTELKKLNDQISLLTKENERLNKLGIFSRLSSKNRKTWLEYKLKMKELKRTVHTLYWDPKQEEYSW